MTTATQACEIVLPGYTLADRIGSGGYAEVWRAEAPGGIQKAVKLVHGYYDDEFALQELKALERVKGVRHPFLLSLERFEVISGRLVILTELADMSLEQRLRACRADGLSGIPRDELLRYMSDAAEAIDFLSQRHQLLHLDIKPENLLILGDHIKVADFGLVKELATRTQNSLVSGMTPTYASPEMFDDNPSIQSDQYSLAIVYQEMLVGTLPFTGRTAAQLTKQHTQLEPQLSSLPVDERPIVARALAKIPEDRYPSCRAFVEALVNRSGALPAANAPVQVPPPAPPAPSKRDPDDTKSGTALHTIRLVPDARAEQPPILATQLVSRKPKAGEPLKPSDVNIPPEVLPPAEANDVELPEVDSAFDREQPTLYVAMGGVGIQTLGRLRALIAPNESAANDNAICMVALDTDRDALREACSNRWKSPMEPADVLHLPLKLPQNYDNARDILSWLSRRWLYNIPRSLETRGYRPLGRVALVDNAKRVLTLLDQKLQHLAQLAESPDSDGQPRDSKVKVTLLTGTGGGTGAGMVLDVANALKAFAASRSLQIEVNAILICTCLVENNSSQLSAANTYALLTELSHATVSGNQATTDRSANDTFFESSNSPFDSVYCIPVRSNAPGCDSLDRLAKYLALESKPVVRAALRGCRNSKTPLEQTSSGRLRLKKFSYASLADQKLSAIGPLALDLAEEVKQYWLTTDRSADWQKLLLDEQLANSPNLASKKVEAITAPIAPENGTPLALRGRFGAFMSLEVTGEVLRQIQARLEDHDTQGRSRLSPAGASLIADSARAAIASLADNKTQNSCARRFCESKQLRPLIVEVSRRVLCRAIEEFDDKQPESFLPTDTALEAECQTILVATLSQPESSDALMELLDWDDAVASTLDRATSDLLQSGSDRRTLLFVPKTQNQNAGVDKLRALRPRAGVVAANVEDVLVVSEDAGISPRAVAIGLERVFPGIADAARRLLTRIDIEWTSLL